METPDKKDAFFDFLATETYQSSLSALAALFHCPVFALSLCCGGGLTVVELVLASPSHTQI